jgi:uncharacterized protein (TIGR02453 family)
MSDGFTEMLDRAQAFYAALAANNSRDWFEPRKPGWKADIEAPARLMADLLAEDVTRMTGTPHAAKLFRINRDVRFSKDKSPYKTSLSMTWAPADADALAPVLYLGIEPGDVMIGCGTPGFAGPDLARYRAMVDAWGDRLAEVIDDTGARIVEIGPAPLKRVPKPYAPDHPHADLMRRKSLALGLGLPEGWRAGGDGLVAAIVAQMERLLPFQRFMAERL